MNINESYYNRTEETWEDLSSMFGVAVSQLQEWNDNTLSECIVVAREETEDLPPSQDKQILETLVDSLSEEQKVLLKQLLN